MGDDAREAISPSPQVDAAAEAATSRQLRTALLGDIFRSHLLLESTQKLAEALKALIRRESR